MLLRKRTHPPGGRGIFLRRDKKEFKGYLDRLRENLESLDEAIADARTNAKKKGKDSNSLQWSNQLLNLIQERNATLLAVKTHLLGRDETGAPVDPGDHYDGNDDAAFFERDFKNFLLRPWTSNDLKLVCEDCGTRSENVWYYTSDGDIQMYANLCGKCYNKRTTESNGENQEVGPVAEPASKRDISAILQTAALSIKALRTFPVD